MTASLYVVVRDNNVDRSLRELRRKLVQNGWFKSIRRSKEFIKPSVLRATKEAESRRRVRKAILRRQQTEGI